MLDTYTVLDLTDERGEIGPMLLGDLGADVIRVEPHGGSSSREKGPFFTSESGNKQSLSFAAFNRNKRSIVLDADAPDDRKVLEALITKADFIFESWPDSSLQAHGFTFDDVKRINPRIIQVCISAFGADGPHSDLRGNDLVVAAMGGPVSLQGIAGRAPVRVTVPQVWRHAGVEAAAGSLAAFHRMLKTGEAQFVDVSAQCTMTWTMLNAMDAYAIQGEDFERSGSFMSNMANPIELVHKTADGYVVATPLGKTIQACVPKAVEEG